MTTLADLKAGLEFFGLYTKDDYIVMTVVVLAWLLLWIATVEYINLKRWRYY